MPGEFTHPKFLEAEARVEQAVLAWEQAVMADGGGGDGSTSGGGAAALGAVALTRERTEELIARGYRLLVGFDVHWLNAALAESQSWLK